jgi:hypothetical protein
VKFLPDILTVAAKTHRPIMVDGRHPVDGAPRCGHAVEFFLITQREFEDHASEVSHDHLPRFATGTDRQIYVDRLDPDGATTGWNLLLGGASTTLSVTAARNPRGEITATTILARTGHPTRRHARFHVNKTSASS